MVAGKRNTAKGLQALVHGVHVVDFSYLDALEYVTTPASLDEPESLCPLERDFDAHWPDPADHLPAPSKEPGQRPGELFAPSGARRTVFEGYTFVFAERKQFDSLQPPITDGEGKALLFEIKEGRTTPAELINFMQEAAGEMQLGANDGYESSKPVLLVCFAPSKDYPDWKLELQNEVCRKTKQNCVEQNEFLDAILTVNPAQLRRPSSATGAMYVNGGIMGITLSGFMSYTDRCSYRCRCEQRQRPAEFV